MCVRVRLSPVPSARVSGWVLRAARAWAWSGRAGQLPCFGSEPASDLCSRTASPASLWAALLRYCAAAAGGLSVPSTGVRGVRCARAGGPGGWARRARRATLVVASGLLALTLSRAAFALPGWAGLGWCRSGRMSGCPLAGPPIQVRGWKWEHGRGCERGVRGWRAPPAWALLAASRLCKTRTGHRGVCGRVRVGGDLMHWMDGWMGG